MSSNKTIESSTAYEKADDTWLQVTPGERLRIRVTSAQTMQAYSVIEVVADPHNGVPLHIHTEEEEHFIVLDGTLDIAVGNRRWDAAAVHALPSKGASLMPGAIHRIIRHCTCWQYFRRVV